MRKIIQLASVLMFSLSLTGCLVTSVVSGAVSAVTTTVGTAVDVVDAVTPDISD